jgi:23S rRNA pseudouridine2604 synthase
MTAPERLSKRVAALVGCSRSEAEQYIEGGWVSVDGETIELPQFKVSNERVEIDPAARLQASEPATLLLHKPAGYASLEGDRPALALVTPATHWLEDPSGMRVLKRHFHRLTPLLPLDTDASGLLVLTQDGRVWRRLTEDADAIEQEFVVEVAGTIATDGMQRLCHGLRHQGRPLPPCKVSWQNETRLRFAIKAVRPGQLRSMCADVGLQVIAIRRLRIGKVPLGKLPLGEWRYLPSGERF